MYYEGTVALDHETAKRKLRETTRGTVVSLGHRMIPYSVIRRLEMYRWRYRKQDEAEEASGHELDPEDDMGASLDFIRGSQA